eukprot:CAMPEP_0170066564 /NCGR_PEP_ID=MMETSP0019_2-20121128/6216_1 /TAXON_ID=98059 /ORGANISM="Dinobryon sp., Strain UTEXLB2267" /LENGTH=570 /DNA_ID=CAMNT_0010273689 /DNA_START=425 /DNA_END=2137 /DNA_ORIENTATION=+
MNREGESKIRVEGDDGTIKKILIRINTTALMQFYARRSGSTEAHSRQILNDIGFMVDSFLTPRPWWTVVKEPYPSAYLHHIKTPHPKNGGKASNTSSTFSDYKSFTITLPLYLSVILQRYPLWEEKLRLIAATQFPSDPNMQNVCSSMSATIGRQSCVHPGWHSVTDNYNVARSNRQFDIFAIFFPIYDQPVVNGGNNSFMSVSDCPNNPNQWTCAFLPMTNCTLPTFITECNNRTCMNTDNFYFSALLFPADATGKLVEKTTLQGSTPITSAAKALHLVQEHRSEFLYMMPYNQRGYRPATIEDIMNSPEALAFVFLFMIRKTYLYRQRIALLLHTFRSISSTAKGGSKTPSTSTPFAPCVAAHVRRGDRVMYVEKTHKAINMTEFCFNASLPRVTGAPQPQCINEKGELSNCPGLNGLSDFGCGPGDVPFESITLLKVIEKAELMVPPHVRSLVLASDDVEWLDEQIQIAKTVAPHWKIFVLPDPTKTSESSARRLYGTAKSYQYVRSEAGTDSGVYFHASIELAQQCQALVAHFGSGIPLMMYRAMCFYHAGIYGVCPPVYHLGKRF